MSHWPTSHIVHTRCPRLADTPSTSPHTLPDHLMLPTQHRRAIPTTTSSPVPLHRQESLCQYTSVHPGLRPAAGCVLQDACMLNATVAQAAACPLPAAAAMPPSHWVARWQVQHLQARVGRCQWPNCCCCCSCCCAMDGFEVPNLLADSCWLGHSGTPPAEDRTRRGPLKLPPAASAASGGAPGADHGSSATTGPAGAASAPTTSSCCCC
jgi:hypothetical protein